MHHHEVKPLDQLTVHDINRLAEDAVLRGESLQESNKYHGHIGAAYEAAYRVHAEGVTV